MKLKNKMMLGAIAGMFTVLSVEAQNTTTVIENPADTSTTVVATPETTTIVNEPAGANYHDTSTSPGWNMRDRFTYDRDEDTELYPDQETTFDLFAAYGNHKSKFNDAFDTTQRRNGVWGAGVGVNFFFAKFFGVGLDAFGLNNDGGLVDAANASLIARLPIDLLHMAPYVFGGGGRQFEGPDSWTAHVGAGLEVRLNRHTGIFLDGRYVFAKRHSVSDYTLLRSGLRFAF